MLPAFKSSVELRSLVLCTGPRASAAQLDTVGPAGTSLLRSSVPPAGPFASGCRRSRLEVSRRVSGERSEGLLLHPLYAWGGIAEGMASSIFFPAAEFPRIVLELSNEIPDLQISF
ncbi:hypothetical protein NDU88_004039 [Pleurodeles waltl]|uniref:Uncharacterized protein n=1 Tax=Pleurodeles waltl TaxID=8319 RepID=A0AAV7RIC3_PLEWA|nr:hypothetical protein NDU88_004039 [Pleurodeles waltl]